MASKSDDQLPTEVEYEADFRPDAEMVDRVVEMLDVHPEWAKQGIYFADNPESFDEVCAWVLENHTRFVVVSSSSSPQSLDLESRKESEPQLVFIINRAAVSNAGILADQVAQAMLDFYIKFQEDQDVKNWIKNGAHKSIYEVENSGELFNINARAEANDMKCLYVNSESETVSSVGPATVLALFSQGDDGNELIKSLKKMQRSL